MALKKKKAKCCCTFARIAPARVMLAPTIRPFCRLPRPKSSRLGQIKLFKPRQMPVLAVVCFCPPSLLCSTPRWNAIKNLWFLKLNPQGRWWGGGEIGQDCRRVYKSSHHFSLLLIPRPCIPATLQEIVQWIFPEPGTLSIPSSKT